MPNKNSRQSELRRRRHRREQRIKAKIREAKDRAARKRDKTAK